MKKRKNRLKREKNEVFCGSCGRTSWCEVEAGIAFSFHELICPLCGGYLFPERRGLPAIGLVELLCPDCGDRFWVAEEFEYEHDYEVKCQGCGTITVRSDTVDWKLYK